MSNAKTNQVAEENRDPSTTDAKNRHLSPGLSKKPKEDETKNNRSQVQKLELNNLQEKSYREFSTPSSVISEISYKTYKSDNGNSEYSFPSSGYHTMSSHNSTPLDNSISALKLPKPGKLHSISSVVEKRELTIFYF